MSYSPFYFNQQGSGSAESLITNYTNASSITSIPQGTLCFVNNAGFIGPVDVSNQATVDAKVGVAEVRIATSGTGPVVSGGRLENFTTSFPVGTPLFVGTDGSPTNIYPEDGVNGFVAGDYVIFLGVLVPNQTNPSTELDIQLFLQVIGVL